MVDVRGEESPGGVSGEGAWRPGGSWVGQEPEQVVGEEGPAWVEGVPLQLQAPAAQVT